MPQKRRVPPHEGHRNGGAGVDEPFTKPQAEAAMGRFRDLTKSLLTVSNEQVRAEQIKYAKGKRRRRK